MKLHANLFRVGAAVALLTAAPLAFAATGLPVAVTNTASNPVPVTGAVGVTSLPSVTITNSTPLNVRDADRPALQPFTAQGFASSDPSSDTFGRIDFTTIPSGKTLVIETEGCDVSALSSNQFPQLLLVDQDLVNPSHTKSQYFFPATSLGTSGGNTPITYFVAQHAVHYYVTAGHQVYIGWAMIPTDNNPIQKAALHCYVSGYLVNAP